MKICFYLKRRCHESTAKMRFKQKESGESLVVLSKKKFFNILCFFSPKLFLIRAIVFCVDYFIAICFLLFIIKVNLKRVILMNSTSVNRAPWLRPWWRNGVHSKVSETTGFSVHTKSCFMQLTLSVCLPVMSVRPNLSCLFD